MISSTNHLEVREDIPPIPLRSGIGLSQVIVIFDKKVIRKVRNTFPITQAHITKHFSEIALIYESLADENEFPLSHFEVG